MIVRHYFFGVALVFIFATGFAVADTTSPSAKVRALFTPGDDIASVMVEAIHQAIKQVRVQAYSFTNKAIARALQAAARRGIAVSVLADREQFERGASFVLRDLRQAGVEIRLDGEHSAAHNKVMVIDGETNRGLAFTGSFNFTQAAQKHNAENVLVIDDAALVLAFSENWLRHWKHSAALD